MTAQGWLDKFDNDYEKYAAPGITSAIKIIRSLLADVQQLTQDNASLRALCDELERCVRKQMAQIFEAGDRARAKAFRELYEIRFEPDKLLCKIEREAAAIMERGK